MRSNDTTQQVPAEVNEMINNYLQLKIKGHEVQVPYFRNVKRVRAELRSLAGKGTPEEIAEETVIYSKLRGFPLQESSPSQIREFMMSQGIGIDCSGFVAHILNRWLRATGKGRIRTEIKFPKTSLYRRIIRAFRPIENISADVLTNSENTDPVSLKDVRVGDLLRLKGLKRGHHVAIVIDVQYQDGLPTSFTYAHSSEEFSNNNGVRIGKVEITDPNGELKDQDWEEQDDHGNCWTLQQLLKEYEDNGLRRPKFFKKD